MKQFKAILFSCAYINLQFLYIFIISFPCFACTIFNSNKGDSILVGNNEDRNVRTTKVWFSPPSPNKHGWIGFGFNTSYPNYPEGGMNDQGLFFDWAALRQRSDVVFPSEKPNFMRYAPVKILEECATIEDVIELYQKYNEPIFTRAHIMWVDSIGNSAIIEWGKNDLSIIRKDGHFQVMTNFNVTDQNLTGGYPCRRHNTASQMLQDNGATIDVFRSILNAVHQEGSYPTQYSNIYNLQNRIIYVYHYHNYNSVIKFDLTDELGKGFHSYELPSLFTDLESHPTESQIPMQSQLYQNHPNPFNPSTTIK